MYGDTRPRRRGRRILLLLGLLAFGFLGLSALRTGAAPEVAIRPELPAIGTRTPVAVRVTEPRRGIARLRAELVQGERVEVLDERTYQVRPPWAFWGPATEAEELRLEVGAETIEGLREGEATLRVAAWPAAAWVRRKGPVVEELTLPVRLRPPSLQILSHQHYPAQGGSEVVLYRAGETAVRHGVEAGGRWFPGHPLPGSAAGESFALFGVPYDLSDPARIRLVAADDVGNEARAAFVDKFFPRPFGTDVLEVTDGFMEKVVPEIVANSPEVSDRGSLLDTYLEVNGELREKNAATLEELARRSRDEFLWRAPFLPMPNAQVMSAFADRRTYLYQGREVDRQDHLGFDLASVQGAPVPAANRGVAVLARYFGIYGNAVVLDHGYGLMSLYGHLSSISVAEGQPVERGQEIGRTGQTGLAGGDHLHFTMLLHGLPVTPVEWWDAHWIRDRIARKLGAALPFEG